MAMVKVTSTQESNIIQNNLLNTKSSNNFLQDSSFVLKLDSNNRNLIKKTNDDEEIDIFSAEKYFNEGIDQENQENPTNLEPKKYNLDDKKFRPKTPSIQSESSWNSRSQLLHNFSRNHQQQQQQQQPSIKSNNNFKKLFATLSCNCVCKGKESVKVDHQICKKQNPIIKTRSLSQSSNHQDLNFIKKVETTRMPLDVFGTEKKSEEKLSVEKKLSMLTWDAVVTKQEEMEDQDYAESDASSDLFEIESFPSYNNNNNATNYYGPSLGRQSYSDGMSSYAPSEVSIEWSVVTASAADFSIMSDTEEFRNGHRIVHQTTDKSKRRSSILLGCNSHKSVGVVGDNNNNAYNKVSERTSMEMQQRQIKNENFMPTTRFHAESKMINRFDGGNRKHDFTANTRSFSSSYAGRPADLLYI